MSEITKADAVVRMMAEATAEPEPMKRMRALLRSPMAFRARLEGYSDEDRQIACDSEEAAEAAQMDADQGDLAGEMWAELTPQERQTLLDLAVKAGADKDWLKETLDLNEPGWEPTDEELDQMDQT